MAAENRGEDAVHRTGQTLGERLLRELQRRAEGRTAQWGDLLQLEGSAHRDRALEKRLQRGKTPQFAWLPATGHRRRRPVALGASSLRNSRWYSKIIMAMVQMTGHVSDNYLDPHRPRVRAVVASIDR